MKIFRTEPATDRAAWEAAAKDAALKIGYEEKSPLVFRRGTAGAFHADARRVQLAAAWADGQGRWEASSCGKSPATRRFLESRLDEIQGKAGTGSALDLLAWASAGGLVAWVLATAVLLIFTVPLCRETQRAWTAKQKYFEQRVEVVRAPTAKRVEEASVAKSAFIPAAALGFLAAIPLVLLLAIGELFAAASRWTLPGLVTACLVLPMALISPGVAFPGLAAGLLAPLAAWAGFAAVRAAAASGHAPAHGNRWAAALAGIVLVVAVPAGSLRGSDLYGAIRDRVLFGTRPGEALATFYYTNTPLAAHAILPPGQSGRNTILIAGASPAGFPYRERRLLEYAARDKEEFLRLARQDEYTLLVWNEGGAAWVKDAAEELKKTDPNRALEFIAVTKGGMEKIFPEAAPEQFLPADMFPKGGKERVQRFDEALAAAYDRADRRRTLRDACGVANTLAILLGPALVLAAYGLWVAAGAAALHRRGLKRAAGALAAAAVLLLLGLGQRVATAEGDKERELRAKRAEFEALRDPRNADKDRLAKLDAAAKTAVPQLRIDLLDPRVGVRVLAADALGASGNFDAYVALGDAVLHDPSILVRYRAADGIGRSQSKNQRIALLSQAQNDEIYVAEVALDAILDNR